MLQDVVDYYSENKMSFDEPFRIRIHRALSWFKKAKDLNLKGELDLSFITMWIGFNSAYGRELSAAFKSEHVLISEFFEKILEQDTKKEISDILWQQSKNAVLSLIQNKFTFEKYWHFVNGNMDDSNWEDSLSKSIIKAKRLVAEKDTSVMLSMVLGRLYTLRNQLLHGGATFESMLNRPQIEDALQLMFEIFPVIVQLMMEAPDKEIWGKPYYMPIKE
ncbi:hypothetical protein SAMN02910357_00032 [Succinivibrio dextrinosolvens]|uniref:HEPN domain-containing protein n=1 Tax=Succinivibrio dextrinosolvens TaxID=83771 RepID=UPI0008EEE8F6|nr:HEPN domain-containing protein [Succinivibrio dextrinosolvens]SFS31476.1 hypothetical protein SAMN02910357_00032 [Succinivibrio dextrinosolvens]